MIAQMRPRKGPEVLLRAFARWREGGGRGVLLMIGDDEFTQGAGYLGSLKTLARDLGIAEAVRFTGFMAEPWTLAGGADLIALPSLFGEGLPLVLLEAMSRAIPLAVSDTAGNRELVRDGACGWIHAPGDPPGDTPDLAHQIDEAASDPEATREKGESGWRYYQDNFTLDRVIGKYRELYQEILKIQPKPIPDPAEGGWAT
jgi:glycosyltransferase involved in cell wall biosynthesis